jgi:hypothetical protein
MGWFDWLTGGEEGQIKRHVKRIRNLNAQAEDRTASAYWLADNASEEAVIGLLGRFTINYEHRMKDTNEKNLVTDLLRGLGNDRIAGPIRAWCRKHEPFARPLSLINDLDGPEAAVDLLLDMLGREVDPFKTEKKRQILIKLSDYADARICARVPACLEDFDEGVRYAAAEALIAQDDPGVQIELAKALAKRDEESNRLRVRIAEAFNKRRWELGAFAEDIAERPPVGWQVEGTYIRPS